MSEREITWDEFRSSGALWFANRLLHVLGLAIVVEVEDGKVQRVFPARVKYRGFFRESEERGFRRVHAYLASESVTLAAESSDDCGEVRATPVDSHPAAAPLMTCYVCGEPATCVGSYEGNGPVNGGCDVHCGHGNEDGWCKPPAEYLADHARFEEELFGDEDGDPETE